MRDDMHRNPGTSTARGTSAASTTGRIASLDELDDYDVADGEPDIRGWDVKTTAGQKVGKVKDLIVDLGAMKVRYVDVELDKKAMGLREDRHVLLPIGTARLDDDHNDVIVRETVADLLASPAYDRSAFSSDYETDLRGWYDSRAAATGGAPAAQARGGGRYDSALFNEDAFWGKRRRKSGAAYLTRSEEELAVGKREVQAGSVDVQKRVETEHVKQQVPVTREEVTVERRPVSARGGASSPREGKIGDDEITVPVMEDEIIVQKRAVPKEEVVIRKEAKRDEKTVEADLRKEQVDVKPKGDVDLRDRR